RRWHYYQRIFSAYLGRGKSQLTFWHETPQVNSRARADRLGEYYMLFRDKADYAGHYDPVGIPMLDYHGAIGIQYNPIAIAQWGLGNFNIWRATENEDYRPKVILAADWLCHHLEPNQRGFPVWHNNFDWEYRETLKAPWYSGLAQGQGISLLVRAHAETGDPKFLNSAERAFQSFLTNVASGGVAFTDANQNLWFEEYIVSKPTHILNGFIWAAWG